MKRRLTALLIVGMLVMLSGAFPGAALADGNQGSGWQGSGWPFPAISIPLGSGVGFDSSSSSGSSVSASIRQVVQKANQEQQQAFDQNNPTLMQDTATSGYYRQMVQNNQGLRSSGVASISLVHLSWGPILAAGQNRARAVTDETWKTTYANGNVQQNTTPNLYTLVQSGGAWKIQSDGQPGVESPFGVTPPGVTTPGQPGVPPVSIAPTGPGQSLNWSGYEAASGKYTSVTGTWTVPQVSAAQGRSSDAAWVGVGGVVSRDLIQAGTEETVGPSGQVRYQAWIETLPRVSHPVALTVKPGDSVTVTLTDQGGTSWLVSFKDNTSGQTYQQPVTYRSSLSSAEWVEEAPSNGRGVLPLDNFGSIHFNAASAVKNGQQVTASQAGAQPITMVSGVGQTLASPSALGSDGGSFTVTRTAAPASVSPGTGITVTPLPFAEGGNPFGRFPFSGLGRGFRLGGD
ncbi:MAG: G1 family glutamic endopeptidase [Chloroflexota bacterium]